MNAKGPTAIESSFHQFFRLVCLHKMQPATALKRLGHLQWQCFIHFRGWFIDNWTSDVEFVKVKHFINQPERQLHCQSTFNQITSRTHRNQSVCARARSFCATAARFRQACCVGCKAYSRFRTPNTARTLAKYLLYEFAFAALHLHINQISASDNRVEQRLLSVCNR